MEDLLNAFFLMSNFVFVPAIAYGSQLALGAVCVTLVYGILRFSNFAHGDIMAFGTMVVILFTWLFQSYGINLGPLPTAILALPFGIIATAIFLLGSDKFVYKFYREKKFVQKIFCAQHDAAHPSSVHIIFFPHFFSHFFFRECWRQFKRGFRVLGLNQNPNLKAWLLGARV